MNTHNAHASDSLICMSVFSVLAGIFTTRNSYISCTSLQYPSCMVSSFVSLCSEDSIYCFHFRMENIIKDLKERSGKSLKVKIENVQEVAVGTALYAVLFLSCAFGKLAIVMSKEKRDKMKILAGRTYFIKNFKHISTILSVPIFTESNSSIFRVSQRASDGNNASFTEEEIANILDQLDIANLLSIDTVANVPQASHSSEDGVVSLPDFISNPSAVNENHVVEVSDFIFILLLYLSLCMADGAVISIPL